MTGTVTHPEWLSTDRGIRDQWSRVCEASERQSFFHEVVLGDRLERLFAVACCREIWPWLIDASRNAVEVAEQYADGLTTVAELNAAYVAAMTAARATTNDAMWGAANAAMNTVATAPMYGAMWAAMWAATYAATYAARYAAACARATGVSPGSQAAAIATQGRILAAFIAPEWEWQVEWGTGDVIAIARQMYDTRDFSAMPILADALTDAGCDDENLLQSLRSGDTPWYRGCRIIDCARGRSPEQEES